MARAAVVQEAAYLHQAHHPLLIQLPAAVAAVLILPAGVLRAAAPVQPYAAHRAVPVVAKHFTK